jgi:hypothetical protein
MATSPRHDFGKRQRRSLPDMPQPKRSSHVALLVMGTLAVGGGAYALMPKQGCQPGLAPAVTAPAGPTVPGPTVPGPTVPGTVAPAVPQSGVGCTTRSSYGSSSGGGGGSYSRSSRLSFFGGGSSSSGSSGGTAESSSGVSRGGFGSFGHAFGSIGS